MKGLCTYLVLHYPCCGVVVDSPKLLYFGVKEEESRMYT
jgi:hypothetical protein